MLLRFRKFPLLFALCILLHFVLVAEGSVTDYVVSPFTPDGRILQLDFAKEAANNGNPVLAIKCSDGLIICSCKPKPKPFFTVRYGPQNNYIINENSMLCVSGWLPDAYSLVDGAKQLNRNYRKTYGFNPTVEHISNELANYIHKVTENPVSRKLGIGDFL